MSQVEYVIPVYAPLIVEQESIINLSDIYNHINHWLNLKGYDFYEREYQDMNRQNPENFSTVKWMAEKKIDEYMMMKIEMRMKTKNIQKVKTDKGTAYKGYFFIKFEAYIEKDYEDNWETSPFHQFVRGFYDKFVIASRITNIKNDLKDEVYNLYNEIKSYLYLHKYQGE